MMNNRGWPHDKNKTVQSIIIGSNSLIALYQTIRDLGIGVLFTFYNSARSLWYWPRPSDTVLLLLGSLGREFVPKRVKINGTNPVFLYSRLCAHHSSLSPLSPSAAMDLYTLIPRTLVGVVYPAFMSLKSVLHGSPESAGAWLRYWVVLGVFSLVELLLDPVINPLRWVISLPVIRIIFIIFSYSFPTYLVVKCLFLVWCMLPVSWNGSDLLFNQVSATIFIRETTNQSILNSFAFA